MTTRARDLHVYPLTCGSHSGSDGFDSRHRLSSDLHRSNSSARRVRAVYAIARIVTVIAAVVGVVGFAAQGQAQAEGPARWSKPVLTVHVADEAAWSGTDIAASLAQWSPALPLVLTDSADADVVLAGSTDADSVEGATAYRDGEGSTITSCRVVLSSAYAGADNGATLTHELGHCLGLAHNNMGAASVMYWIEGGEHSSATVTDADLDAVRSLNR